MIARFQGGVFLLALDAAGWRHLDRPPWPSPCFFDLAKKPKKCWCA